MLPGGKVGAWVCPVVKELYCLRIVQAPDVGVWRDGPGLIETPALVEATEEAGHSNLQYMSTTFCLKNHFPTQLLIAHLKSYSPGRV